jgi:hypothetical protein
MVSPVSGFPIQPVANATCLVGLFDQVPAIGEPSYFGTFDYGQDLASDALDPSFFTLDRDLPTFESMLDDFVAEQGNM